MNSREFHGQMMGRIRAYLQYVDEHKLDYTPEPEDFSQWFEDFLLWLENGEPAWNSPQTPPNAL
ncbi:MAG: hypothetical protein MN733_05485 [Nitrososphaera sp.]|nr:hypothetical protein [Nitrososphaera sp.]